MKQLTIPKLTFKQQEAALMSAQNSRLIQSNTQVKKGTKVITIAVRKDTCKGVNHFDRL